MKQFKRFRRIIAIGSTAVLLAVVAFFVLPVNNPPSQPNVETGGILGIDASVLLAVTTIRYADSQPVNLTPSDPIVKTGGLPIISIDYSNGISVDFAGGFPDLSFSTAQLEQWARNITVAEAEAFINEQANSYLEIAIPLADLIDAGDTPATNPLLTDPPTLEANERIEKIRGKDHLVITCGYFEIHFYTPTPSFNEGDFITKLSNKPITGEWWS